ncbi:phosphatidylinositol 4-kinase type 2-alpha (Phosphatidylinositol 4-kinase type II-alpha), partial [Trichinella spiralis]
ISLFEVIYVFGLILVLFDIRHPYMTEWHEAYNPEKLLIYLIQYD